MIKWGISANSHDAAIAVFDNDKLVFASHSERFSGIKNDRDLCDGIVNYAKQWGEPDQVFWYEKPRWKTFRQLLSGQGWKWTDNNIKKYLQKWNINAKIQYIEHHHSHAAAGYFTSEFTDACVIVIDAIGEFDTLTIWHAQQNKLTKVYSQRYPHSIGLWYSAMTQRVGLKPNEDEYILMGMAAYGDDRYTNRIYEDFIKDDNYTFKQNLHRGCLDWAPELIIKDSFDIAAGTQEVYETLFMSIIKQASETVKSKNLVLMGGCALNCVANRLIGRFYDNYWIMPNPGDAGSAVGAVLAHTKQHIPWLDSFHGYDIGSTTSNDEIVNYLLERKICGLARGKAEFGPRALGNRSLLADPRGIDIKEKINDIKQRQQFRPFAPAILEEHVHDYFIMPNHCDTSRYMQAVATCRDPELYPAIVHRDGTSRVQTVPNYGSPFRKLLELWYEKSGCPMLLNTSLNIKGQPMVNTIEDANQFEKLYNTKVFN
jgi:carbamoyltransferase